MQISPLQRHVNASELPLEHLADNPNVSEAEKVAEASRQFEAILLRQILTTAKVFTCGPESNSGPGAIYQDLVTYHLANTMSHGEGIGLSDSLVKELSHQLNMDQASSSERKL